MANRQLDVTKGFYRVPPAWHSAVPAARGVAPTQTRSVGLQDLPLCSFRAAPAGSGPQVP